MMNPKVMPRFYFENEHFRRLVQAHAEQRCDQQFCPHCAYEAQFADQDERQEWERKDRADRLKTLYIM